MRLKRKLRALRTSQHVRKGYRLAAIEKAQQIMREIMCTPVKSKGADNGR